MTSSTITHQQESEESPPPNSDGNIINKNDNAVLPLWEKIERFQEWWETTLSSSVKASSEEKEIFGSSIAHVSTIREEDLQITKLLGRGAFADVNQAYEKEDSDRIYAIKRLRASTGMTDDENLHICITDLAFETAILSNIRHNNIIPLLGIKEGDAFNLLRNGNFFVALEVMVETLYDRLKRWKTQRKRQRLSITVNSNTVIERLKNVAMGIVSALEYLHSNRILYRDMKPTNVGFDDLNDEVKLFDFGFARVYNTHDEKGIENTRLMTGGIGTPRYMAPEIARHDAMYGFPVDVYSFSIMLWQIVTNRTPFKEIKSASVLAAKVVMGNKRPPVRFVQSEALRKLLKSGWSANPTDRPNFSEIRETLDTIIKQHYSSSSLSCIGGENKYSQERHSRVRRYFRQGSKASELSREISQPSIVPMPKDQSILADSEALIFDESSNIDENNEYARSNSNTNGIEDTVDDYSQRLNDRTEFINRSSSLDFLADNMSVDTISFASVEGSIDDEEEDNTTTSSAGRVRGIDRRIRDVLPFFKRTTWKMKKRNSMF